MIRFVLALLMLLALRPGPAGASMPTSGASDLYRLVASDPEFVFGAVRSGSGWELLLEMQTRLATRAKPNHDGPPWTRRGRSGEQPGMHVLLPLRTRGFIRTREIGLRRAESVCRYHDPCQANPPPLPHA